MRNVRETRGIPVKIFCHSKEALPCMQAWKAVNLA